MNTIFCSQSLRVLAPITAIFMILSVLVAAPSDIRAQDVAGFAEAIEKAHNATLSHL